MQDSRKKSLSLLTGAVLALVAGSLLMAVWPSQSGAVPVAVQSVGTRERREHHEDHDRDDERDDEHEEDD